MSRPTNSVPQGRLKVSLVQISSFRSADCRAAAENKSAIRAYQISPEGTAESSPGRQSWVNLDRTRMLTGDHQKPARFSLRSTASIPSMDYLHTKPDLFAHLYGTQF